MDEPAATPGAPADSEAQLGPEGASPPRSALLPYAVLEVKVYNGQVPEWLSRLVGPEEPPALQEVPKFSKFQHACARFRQPRHLPHWFEPGAEPTAGKRPAPNAASPYRTTPRVLALPSGAACPGAAPARPSAACRRRSHPSSNALCAGPLSPPGPG